LQKSVVSDRGMITPFGGIQQAQLATQLTELDS